MRDRDAAMTHSPEPWKPQITGGGIKPRRYWAEASDGHLVCRDTEESPLGDANMERICACVNALAGIPDPARFMKRVKMMSPFDSPPMGGFHDD